MLSLLFLRGLGEHLLFGISLLGLTFPLSSEKPQNSKYVGQLDMDPFKECPLEASMFRNIFSKFSLNLLNYCHREAPETKAGVKRSLDRGFSQCVLSSK